MGYVHQESSADVVLPEIFVFRGLELLLVHGTERGQSYWWPPGAYWVRQRACDLKRETPEQWIERALMEQLQSTVLSVRLRKVAFIAVNHPPVMIFEVTLAGPAIPSANYDFDAAAYFRFDEMPEAIGRDREHGRWLRSEVASIVGKLSK